MSTTVLKSITKSNRNYKTISIVIFTTEITLVILGLTGNFLCFAVTVKTKLRKMSSTVYLSVLVVCDSVILLWTNVVGSLMSYDLWLGKDVRHLHLVFCWGLGYAEYWLPPVKFLVFGGFHDRKSSGSFVSP